MKKMDNKQKAEETITRTRLLLLWQIATNEIHLFGDGSLVCSQSIQGRRRHDGSSSGLTGFLFFLTSRYLPLGRID